MQSDVAYALSEQYLSLYRQDKSALYVIEGAVAVVSDLEEEKHLKRVRKIAAFKDQVAAMREKIVVRSDAHSNIESF